MFAIRVADVSIMLCTCDWYDCNLYVGNLSACCLRILCAACVMCPTCACGDLVCYVLDLRIVLLRIECANDVCSN